MRSCEDYDDLLLDSLYGLLEPDDERGLRTHVTSCERCQASWAEANKQQSLFTRAAQVYQKLPAFGAPQDNEPAPTETETPPPQTIPLPQRRPVRWKRWAVSVAAAAVVVVAVGGSVWYKGRCDGYLGQTSEARQQIDRLDRQIKLVHQKVLQGTEALPVRVPSPTHIQLLGPAIYHPDARSPYRITTRDVFGKLQATPIVVRWKGDDVHEFRFDSTGEQLVSLPANLLGKDGRAILEVEGRPGTEPVRESIKIEAPALVTHLATSKSVYRIGEVLFFRTLTLQRFSLQPPAEKIALAYALVDSRGVRRKQSLGVTNQGGIGGGEFALTKELPDGDYTLEVSEYVSKDAKLKPRGTRVTPQRQRVTIIRSDAAPIPIDSGVANATALVGQQLSGVIGLVPAITPRLTVDFFPEGGDLVAGLPTRVYYRVRSSLGEATETDGRVILMSSKEVLLDAPRGQGIGVFTFTPQPGEICTARVTWPQRPGESRNWVEILNPFDGLIQPRGLALTVPQAVGREGDPLAIVLRNTGPELRVLLLAVCRGRVVDQRFAQVPAGTTKDGAVTPGAVTVSLSPVHGATGLMAITAYRLGDGGQLVPVAERLVYRAPAEELVLSARTDKAVYQPGDPVDLHAAARNPHGAPVPAWIMGIVVAQKLAPQHAGLPAHFLLLSETGADLENAGLLVHEPPSLAWVSSLFPNTAAMIQAWDTARRLESRHAVDLHLGTHGWRRIVRQEAPVFVRDGNATGDAPVLLSSENARPEQLAKQYHLALHKALEDMRLPLEQEWTRLDGERGERVRQARLSTLALIDFQEHIGNWLRMGVGGVILVLLGVGGLFVLVGVTRMTRRQGSPRPLLATAFGSLVAALVIYGITSRLGLNEARGGDDLLVGLDNALRLQPADLPALRAPKSEAAGLLFARTTARNDARDASFAASALVPQTAMLKEAVAFARAAAHAGGGRDADTPLWAPSVLLKDGTTRFSFRLPQNPGAYDILLYGHTASGRLGFYRGTLDISPSAKQ